MNIGGMFPSKYLKASDLQGRRVLATIEGVGMMKVGSDEKPIIYFQNKTKGLLLNRTNARMIAEIAGTEETDNWGGVKIVIYAAKVDYAGRRVDALRIDYPTGTPKPPPAADDGDAQF